MLSPLSEHSEAGKHHLSPRCSRLELLGETLAASVRSESALKRVNSCCLLPAPAWSF